eukprot:scaffold128006_cov69-Phaeocystis_antarctica.AAC.7
MASPTSARPSQSGYAPRTPRRSRAPRWRASHSSRTTAFAASSAALAFTDYRGTRGGGGGGTGGGLAACSLTVGKSITTPRPGWCVTAIIQTVLAGCYRPSGHLSILRLSTLEIVLAEPQPHDSRVLTPAIRAVEFVVNVAHGAQRAAPVRVPPVDVSLQQLLLHLVQVVRAAPRVGPRHVRRRAVLQLCAVDLGHLLAAALPQHFPRLHVLHQLARLLIAQSKDGPIFCGERVATPRQLGHELHVLERERAVGRVCQSEPLHFRLAARSGEEPRGLVLA